MIDISYTVVRKKGITSSISISVSGDKGVVVRAPFWMTRGMINNFVQEKASWIHKNTKRLHQNKTVKQYINGEKHLYFGKEYPLEVIFNSTNSRCKIEIIDERIRVELSEKVPSENISNKIKDALLYWYLEKGIEAITEKVNYFSNKMNVNYQRIDLKKVTTIWGSCSPSNKLSFNRKLVMAPHEVVDYVVIHEVAHLVHRNHGQEFWKMVESYDKEYKTHRKWLKVNHQLLSL